MRFKKGDIIIESNAENTFNLYERAGFAPIAEEITKEGDSLEELREKAKKLNIKSYHNMKKETLLERIKE